MSIGVANVLPKVTKDEMEELAGVLKKAGDKREGQILANYDRVFKTISAAIKEHDLQRPILFQSNEIDRTSAIYFNTNQEASIIQ